jgi:hypothetical protein
MTIDVNVLNEVYSILKQYVPQKDRQEASDNIMSLLVDMLDDEELKEFSLTDSYTKRSFEEYAGDVDVDDDGYN